RIFIGLGVMAAAITVVVFHAHGGLWTYGGWEEGPGYTIMAIGWGGLVAAGATAVRGTIPARLLGARWLRALGKYSYAMYVFHVPIWAHVQPLVFPGNRVPAVFGSHVLPSLALGVLCGLLAFAAALASWNLYEKQFLKLKRYFEYAPKVRGGTRASSDVEEPSFAGAARTYGLRRFGLAGVLSIRCGVLSDLTLCAMLAAVHSAAILGIEAYD